MTPERVLGALGSAGILIGSLVNWYGYRSSNSFHVPLPLLFDHTTTSTDPKLAYPLLILGIVGLVVSLLDGPAFVRLLCGGLAVVAAALFLIMVRSGSSRALGHLLGAGLWITGLSGIVLLVGPALSRFALNPRSRPDPPPGPSSLVARLGDPATAGDFPTVAAAYPKVYDEARSALSGLPERPQDPEAWLSELCVRLTAGSPLEAAAARIPLNITTS